MCSAGIAWAITVHYVNFCEDRRAGLGPHGGSYDVLLLAVTSGMRTAVVTAHRMRSCRTRAGRGDPRDQKRERRSYKQDILHHKTPFCAPQ
jgi:hypothetical protein